MAPLPSSSSVVPESISGVQELPIIESGFQLLASLFRYPDQSLWQALAEALPAAEAFSSSLLGHPLSLPLRHSLEQTYTTLFCSTLTGSSVSLCLGGYLNQAEHAERGGRTMIRQLLTEEGLAVDVRLDEPEDHLSVLLELAGLLCCKAHGDDPTRAADGRIRLLQLTDSLLIMLPSFQSAIAAADGSCVDFYVDAVTLCLCLIVLCREQILAAQDFKNNLPPCKLQTLSSAVAVLDPFAVLKQTAMSGGDHLCRTEEKSMPFACPVNA